VGNALVFLERCVQSGPPSLSRYFLGLKAGELRRADAFENLIGLNGMRGVTDYAYQMETIRKVLQLFRGRVLLADEVGLGKTVEAGMVIREYVMRGMVSKALILTPPALVSQWCDELSSKFDLDVVSADSPEMRRDPEKFWRNHDLIVASLAMARNKRHSPILADIGFDLLVVDEAHHVKNDRTVGWKLVNNLRSRFLLLLSATPIETDLMDLYSLITLLKPGQLGTKAVFRKEFVSRKDPTTARNRERLRELLREVMIRNTRATADIKLPPRHATTVLVQGEPSERELYAQLTDLVRSCYRKNLSRLSLGLLLQEAGSGPRAVQKTLLKLADNQKVDEELAEQMRKLAKLCGYLPGTAKLGRLLEIVRTSGEKVIVFTRFAATLDELAEGLEDAGVEFSLFSGSLSAAEKDRAVAEFQESKQVMLCTEIGGEGRNLQFCSTLVNYDLPWNPMKIEQRIGRIHRIGQTNPVHVYNMCAANTAEHRILEILDRRLNLFELVIGEVDLVLGQLKSEEEFEDRVLSIYGESESEDDLTKAFAELGDELLDARSRYESIKKLDSQIFSTDYET
jgi:SNF2 family DNA or RNA helicase